MSEDLGKKALKFCPDAEAGDIIFINHQSPADLDFSIFIKKGDDYILIKKIFVNDSHLLKKYDLLCIPETSDILIGVNSAFAMFRDCYCSNFLSIYFFDKEDSKIFHKFYKKDEIEDIKNQIKKEKSKLQQENFEREFSELEKQVWESILQVTEKHKIDDYCIIRNYFDQLFNFIKTAYSEKS